MPAKIRLQRKGKKGQPFYHIVIADGRAPRDGKFIEKIGYYNPLTKPAEIEIDFESALTWLQKGAQPTDTVRSILSYKGIIYKNHLLKGVQKGALTSEQAEEKFNIWLTEKEARVTSKKKEQELSRKEARKKALEHEQKVNESKAQALAKKYAAAQKAESGSGETVEPEHPDEAHEITQSHSEEPPVEEVRTENQPATEPAAEEAQKE